MKFVVCWDCWVAKEWYTCVANLHTWHIKVKVQCSAPCMIKCSDVLHTCIIEILWRTSNLIFHTMRHYFHEPKESSEMSRHITRLMSVIYISQLYIYLLITTTEYLTSITSDWYTIGGGERRFYWWCWDYRFWITIQQAPSTYFHNTLTHSWFILIVTAC